jgi:hypothetical protein
MNKSESSDAGVTSIRTAQSDYASLDFLDVPDQFVYDSRSYKIALPPVSDNFIPILVEKSSKWTFGVFVKPMLSFVRSSFDEIMQEPGYSRNIGNIGGGFEAGYNIGKFGLRTGASISSLSYAPREVVEYVPEADSHVSLENISVDHLNIPLHLTYDLVGNENWQIYGLFGLSARLALITDYEFEVQENGLAYLIKDLKTNPVYSNSLTSQKDYQSGAIDGGNPGSMLSASVDLGLGLAYNWGNNWSLFLEPVYAHDLKKDGFGPNHDKIHCLSINAGIRGSLN